MAVTSDAFREALSRFASGVTVVTTRDLQGNYSGLTVSAFCSVSLEPPLVLICIEKAAGGHSAIEASGKFAVNFLSGEQSSLSDHFASSIEDRLATVDHTLSESGLPLIAGSICHLECEVKRSYDGGDHTIFVAQVENSVVADGDPLVYFRSGYRNLSN